MARPTTRLALISRPLCVRCQPVPRVLLEAGAAGMARPRGERAVGWWRAREWLVRRAGVAGCELAALESESFPGCPPGPLAAAVAVAFRASAWRRAKTASLLRRLRHR